MNAGPSGFGNAPVSKAVLVATAAASVVTQAARASHKRVPLALQLLSRSFVFRTQGELLFGCILLYYFRIHERQHGSSKYGACVCATTGIAYILQLAVTKVLGNSTQLSTGPFAVIFAGIIQFAMDIPATSRFTVLGIRMNDKTFIYLAAMQLLLSGGRKSVLAGACGLLAGILYRLNLARMKEWRLPAAVVRFLGSTLGTDHRPVVGAGSGAAAGAGAGAGAAGAAAAGRGFGPGTQPAPGARLPQPSAEAVQQLVAMGFEHQQAARALQQTNNDVQAAISLLL